MYEYLLENLISYSQVDGNLRRTADRGLVSELYRKQMNALALKYFGVDSNGKILVNDPNKNNAVNKNYNNRAFEKSEISASGTQYFIWPKK